MANHWMVTAVTCGVLLVIAPAMMDWGGRRPGEPPPFESWRAALVEEAVGRGFDRRLVQQAVGNLAPLRVVVELDRVQAQTPPGLEAYLAQRVTPELIARGREMTRRHRLLLEELERAFGVQRRFIVAIWGGRNRIRKLRR